MHFGKIELFIRIYNMKEEQRPVDFHSASHRLKWIRFFCHLNFTSNYNIRKNYADNVSTSL
jgi:hypothetical protein